MLLDKKYWELLLAKTRIYLCSHLGLICLGYFIVVAILGGIPAVRFGLSILIEVLGAIEIAWYLFWFLPYRTRLQRKPGYIPPPLTKAQRQALFRAVLEYVPDYEHFTRRWFRNAHMEDIRRENVKDWLLWLLFEREGSQDEKQGGEGDVNIELEDYITELEEKLEMRIKPGRGEAEALRPSFDPVKVAHRSLTYYTVSCLCRV
jgi:hypothetical protein